VQIVINTKFILLIFIAIGSITCSSDIEEYPPNANLILDEDGKIIEGEYTKFFEGGKVAAIMHFKNRELNGHSTKYYDDGVTKRSELEYSNGKLEGMQKRFYKSGKLYKEELYNAGKRDGLTKKYRENGNLMSEAIFKNGYEGTDLKEYLTDGELKKIYPKIIIKTENKLKANGTFIINVSISNKSEKVEYYLGQLDEGIFLSDKLVRQYNVTKGVLSFTINLQRGEIAEGEYYFVAKEITRLNNVHIMARKHSVKVVNPRY
jgi:hypothetical protein